MKGMMFGVIMLLFTPVAFSQNTSKVNLNDLSPNDVAVVESEKIKVMVDSLVTNTKEAVGVRNNAKVTGKDEVTIVGNNVIIGSYNTIIIVDDKAKVDDVLKSSGVKKRYFSRGFFDRISFGIGASTMGPGIEVMTTLSQNLNLRLGYNFLEYKSPKFTVGIDDENIKGAVDGNFSPDYTGDGKFKLNHGHVLFDIHPMSFGIFHLTAGVFMGKNEVKVKGRLANPDTGGGVQLADNVTSWPQLGFHDYNLNIRNDGTLDADLKLGNFVKPYVGIGLGKSIPKSRLGFKFELGALYNGDYKLSQNGEVLASANQVSESFKDVDEYTKYFKWWPVINFQLIYRLK
ncbi:MAG: hypothetical protein RL662_1028 [Bacteroidota bacterium]|jgi:opacity protein-like surface antigen